MTNPSRSFEKGFAASGELNGQTTAGSVRPRVMRITARAGVVTLNTQRTGLTVGHVGYLLHHALKAMAVELEQTEVTR